MINLIRLRRPSSSPRAPLWKPDVRVNIFIDSDELRLDAVVCALAVGFDEFDVSEWEVTDFVVQFTLTLAVHVLLGHGYDVANLRKSKGQSATESRFSLSVIKFG